MMDKEYPKGTEYRKWRRTCGAGTVLLCMALLLMLSGCGRGKEEDAAPEGIYVPEFIPIEGEYVDYDGARVAGNHLCYLSFSWNEEIQYYTQVINRLSLEERTLSSFPLAWPEGPQAQAAQKETLVLGVLTGGYNYEPAVVRFNRSNEKYRVVLKEYYKSLSQGGFPGGSPGGLYLRRHAGDHSLRRISGDGDGT